MITGLSQAGAVNFRASPRRLGISWPYHSMTEKYGSTATRHSAPGLISTNGISPTSEIIWSDGS
jgi:hypothetical protein